METIKIKDEFIKLGQALKLAGLVESGVDAKFVIQDGLVKVNGEVETRRGKKLVPGDTFTFENTTVTVEQKWNIGEKVIIKSIELINFRNYESLSLNFDKGTNILYGDNAQGKTNVLEGIYVSATTKSHRGNKDKELIKFDEEEGHIRTYLLRRCISTRYSTSSFKR